MSAVVRLGGLAVYEHGAEVGTVSPSRIVFVHGAMDRGAAFLRATRHLRHHEVVRYDRRGYGRSRDAGACTSVDGSVDDLLVVLDGRPAVVVGHSLGGVVALAAADRRPDLVRAVGAFEAPAPWLDWWPGRSAGSVALGATDLGPAEVAERFMRRMVGDDRWEALPESTREVRRAEGPALVADLTAIRGEAPYDVGRLVARGTPVVVGHGSASKPHHVRAACDVHAVLPGSELVVIEGARHDAHTSHSAEFAAFVERAAAAVSL